MVVTSIGGKYTYSTLLTRIVEIEGVIGEFYKQASKATGERMGELFKKTLPSQMIE